MCFGHVGCVSNPCVYGNCYSPVGTNSYTCTCNPGITGPDCDVLSASASVGCTFEYGERCFLTQDKTDKFDWGFASDGTPSSNTGPSNAHGGYQFMYTEASSPRVQGEMAVLVNSVVQLASAPRCLSFWYHMYGAGMGTLNVYTEGLNVPKSVVFTASGNKGDQWLKQEVDIPALTNLKIYFEGVRGIGWDSDMALDDILLKPGNPTTQVPTPAPTTQAPTPAPTTKAPTPAPTTTQAPTTKSPTTQAPTTKAPTTQAPTTKAPTTQAPTTKAPTTQAPTTKAPTTQAPTTKAPTTKAPTTQAPTTQAPTTKAPTTKVPTTKAPTTKAPTTQAPATKAPTTKAPTTKAPTLAPTTQKLTQQTSPADWFTCDFEDGESCIFADSENDDFDWTRGTGTTPSFGTGPDGANSGSYYMYTEVSSPVQNQQKAVLTTEWTVLQSSPWCLTFSYHMKGEPGTLGVAVGEKGKVGAFIWSVTGSQGNSWNTVSVNIPQFLNPEIQIHGSKGDSYMGDIAIDSLVLSKGVCVVPTYRYTCDFEDSESCIFTDSSNDDFDWSRRTGTTPSSGTGPDGAVNGLYYMYIEVSSPVQNYQKAVLTTENIILKSSPWCLTFSYHMKGYPGTLGVAAGEKGQVDIASAIWSKTGAQGDNWITVSVDIPQLSNPEIRIHGSKGTSYQGDIAIDNLILEEGQCTASGR